MCEQSEGAKLKAWRERLGKDEAWIEAALDASPISRTDGTYGMRGIGYGSARRIAAEGGEGDYYSDRQRGELIKAYRAALEAEEARQVAERAQAEPVCPEGVYTTERHDPSRGPETVIRWSSEETELFVGYRETEDDVKAARFYLELVTFRARKHADGDRQRKLDAVRAAENALEKAKDASRAAHAEMRRISNEMDHADVAVGAAHRALDAARREAGL